MSLDWNAEKTAAYRELGEGEYTTEQRNVLEALIWGSLTVSLPGIPTEADADEFLARLELAHEAGQYNPPLPDHKGPFTRDQLVALPPRTKSGGGTWTPYQTPEGEDVSRFAGSTEEEGPWYVSRYRLPTREEMQEWVGLTTNVPRKSREAWMRKLAA